MQFNEEIFESGCFSSDVIKAEAGREHGMMSFGSVHRPSTCFRSSFFSRFIEVCLTIKF